MTPPVAGPGQPFKLQVRIESDVILGPADRVGRELKPPKGMALRFSGQLFRSNTTEATLNFSRRRARGGRRPRHPGLQHPLPRQAHQGPRR